MGTRKSKKKRTEQIEVLSSFLPLNDATMNRFLDAWQKLNDYVYQENALTSLIDTYKENTDVSIVLLKCTVLNQFYSTRINSTDLIILAKHIVSLNIDERLKIGDWSVVSDIACCPGLSNYISFASKYCNWHNHEAYPIYDKYVVDLLCALKDYGCTFSFKTKSEIKNGSNIKHRYEMFGQALKELVGNNNFKFCLNNKKSIIFKVLDRALWLLAKYCLGEEISVIDIAEAIGECVLKYVYDKYIISKAKNGAIAVSKNVSKKRLNTTGTLHSICKEMNIKYTKTTTNTELGKKIIEFINSNS